MSQSEPESPLGEVTSDWFRRESARLVAMLARQFGTHRLQLAEDVVQEALVRALQTWPYRGMPENPAAWLTQTARNLALDYLRREQRWREKEDGIALEHDRWMAANSPAEENTDTFVDDTLRMMFVCFHPQLSTEAQIALALRTLCGLSAAEIAAAFLTSEAAIAKRLVRARLRIRELELPFAVPVQEELPARLDGVLETLYLLFNEGYKASSGDRLVKEELCHEAIRLAVLLAAHPATHRPQIHALIALMLLNTARLSARVGETGNLLRLHEQDRTLWNRAMIEHGIHHLGQAASGGTVTEYHLEAGIAACHAVASSASTTNWTRILALYDQLVVLNPSPVVQLNRTVALEMVQGPLAALDALENIPNHTVLESYHLYHAVHGSLLSKLKRTCEALAAFHKAGQLATLPLEREFISRLIQEIPA